MVGEINLARRFLCLLLTVVLGCAVPIPAVAQWDLNGDGVDEIIFSRPTSDGGTVYETVDGSGAIHPLLWVSAVEGNVAMYAGAFTSPDLLQPLLVSKSGEVLNLSLYSAGRVTHTRSVPIRQAAYSVLPPDDLAAENLDDLVVTFAKGSRRVWRIMTDPFELRTGKSLGITFGSDKDLPFLWRPKGGRTRLAMLERVRRSAGPVVVRLRSVGSKREQKVRIPRDALVTPDARPYRVPVYRQGVQVGEELAFVADTAPYVIARFVSLQGRILRTQIYPKGSTPLFGRFIEAGDQAQVAFFNKVDSTIQIGPADSNSTDGSLNDQKGGTSTVEMGEEVTLVDDSSVGSISTEKHVAATPTPLPLATSTQVAIATATKAVTPAATPTHIATIIHPTATATFTPTLLPPTATLVATSTATNTPSPTYSPSLPPTTTPTATNTATNIPTNTPSWTASFTPTYTPTPTSTYTPTVTPTFTATYTPTQTPTNTPIQLAGYSSALLRTAKGPFGVAVGDMNGDGRKEILAAAKTDGKVSMLTKSALGVYSTTTVQTVTNAEDIEVGDFNGDGKLDYVQSAKTSQTVQIMLGNGNGSFTASQTFSGQNCATVAVGDLNGDDNLDFVGVGSSTAKIFLGAGDGTFTLSTTSIRASAWRVVLSDVTGDDNLDLIVGYDSSYISFSPGNGDGTFGTKVDYDLAAAGGLYHDGLVTGDFNEDGDQDLAVTSWDNGKLFILNGNGSGGFTVTSTITTDLAPWEIRTGDLNGDANLDLVWVNWSSSTVSIRLGDGTGNFSSGSTVALADNTPRDIVLFDEDNDGDLDAVVSLKNGDGVVILKGDGAGNLAAPNTLISSHNVDTLALGHMNNDAFLDVVGGVNLSHSLIVALGNGNGSFGAPTEFLDGGHYGIVTDDFNGDTNTDAAVVQHDNTFRVRMGNGAGGFGTSSSDLVTVPNGFDSRSIAKGDFDNDDDTDLVVTNDGSSSVTVALNDGTGSFTPSSQYSVQNQPRSVAVGDVDGDGDLDLVTANYGAASVSLLINQGAGTFASAINYTVTSNPDNLDFGDLNGDGRADVAVSSITNGVTSVLLGAAGGSLGTPTTVAVGSEAAWTRIADMDNDGDRDVLVLEKGDNQLSVLWNNGSAAFPTRSLIAVPSTSECFEIADTNNDGLKDIVLASDGTAETIITVLAVPLS